MTIYATNSETYIATNPVTGRAWRSAEWIVESPDKWIYTKYNENGTVNRRSVYESPGAQHFGAVNTSLSRHRDRAGLHWEAHGKLIDLEALANVPGISWGELATIQEAARTIARRAGITREARREGCSLI